ncbi:MAG: TonB family protein [Clostridiales bacterium]|nr:TonB family protein [Clostridiales bacterium]
MKSDTIFLDIKWEKASKDNFFYYRVLTKDSNDIYECKDFWRTGEIQMQGKLSSLYPQTRESKFCWYYKNGNLRQTINYRNNKIVGLIQNYDTTGKFEFEYIYDIDSLDNSKRFKQCINNFGYYVSKNLKYPKNSLMSEIEGKVLTQFFIDNTGNITKFSIVKSVNEELDNEARRVIYKYKRWEIPKYKGENTFFEIYFPVIFSLR